MSVRDRPAEGGGTAADGGGGSARRWAVDAGLGAVLAVVLAFWAYRVAISWGPGYWEFGCAAGAVVCAIALARRRQRSWAAVAGQAVALTAVLASAFAGLPAEPGPATALALGVLAGSAVRVLPPRAACAVAAAGLAVAASGLLAERSAGGALLAPPVTVLNAGTWLAGVLAGLGARALALRRAAMAETVRRQERLQLARELHDVVAHHVTGIVLQSQAAQVLSRRQPERVSGALTGIETAGTDALAAMRRLVGLLRDAAAPAPPRESLAGLVGRFDGPAVRLRLPDAGEDETTWPPEVAGTVYRVVRESLTNVSRHARDARSVEVTVAREGAAVTVEVADDAPPVPARAPHRRRRGSGAGAGYRHGGGYGLLGMRERVEALGGTLHAGPRREAPGWSVRAVLPLPPARGGEGR
ncbi:histidine kinase [Actinomadura sp. ATCC 31491]|uniref:histidine kinase n=1 Tax=Actinomadura luzonensis TaxID=2805427 RepID=A0ABT0G466_9ACTN|nr:histidine kinase [Actinomadura luzonensis]MCK2219395.1 histidine kinase [Actinomadura luzonensis]